MEVTMMEIGAGIMASMIQLRNVNTTVFAASGNHSFMPTSPSASRHPFPFSEHQVVNEKSTVISKLRLSDKDSDPCFKFFSNKVQAECLQPVLEAYYGENFTRSCPEISLILAEDECKGCPWRRIDPSALISLGNTSLPSQKDLFDDAKSSCRIASHIARYRDRTIVINTIFNFGILAAILLAAVSAMGAFSGIDGGILTPVYIFGWEVPEALYLGALWAVFYTAHFLLLASDDYFEFCESFSSYYSQSQVKLIAYFTTLAISVLRCFLYPLEREDDDGIVTVTSWINFLLSGRESFKPSEWRRLRLIRLFIFLSFACVCAMFATDFLLKGWIVDMVQGSMCKVGEQDLRTGVIQYLKVALQVLAVIVYALRPRKMSKLGKLRHCVLALLSVLAIAILGLTYTKYHRVFRTSMLIPHIMDYNVSHSATEMVHVLFLHILVIMEIWLPTDISHEV